MQSTHVDFCPVEQIHCILAASPCHCCPALVLVLILSSSCLQRNLHMLIVVSCWPTGWPTACPHRCCPFPCPLLLSLLTDQPTTEHPNQSWETNQPTNNMTKNWQLSTSKDPTSPTTDCSTTDWLVWNPEHLTWEGAGEQMNNWPTTDWNHDHRNRWTAILYWPTNWPTNH